MTTSLLNCQHHFILALVIILHSCALTSPDDSSTKRADVTLRFYLKDTSGPQCDATIYKVSICIGSRLKRCSPFEAEQRYVQDQCADRGSAEVIDFSVDDVDSVIQLNVEVQKTGTSQVHQLRGTEMHLKYKTEVTASSEEFNLVVVFQSNYTCVNDFYGESCKTFCNSSAKEYLCDPKGNRICKAGYYAVEDGSCQLDKCRRMPTYCKNDGVCVNNPKSSSSANGNVNNLKQAHPKSSFPLCMCPTAFTGDQCERRASLLPNDDAASNKRGLVEKAASSDDSDKSPDRAKVSQGKTLEASKSEGIGMPARTAAMTGQKYLLWLITGICVVFLIAICILIIFVLRRQHGTRHLKTMQTSVIGGQHLSSDPHHHPLTPIDLQALNASVAYDSGNPVYQSNQLLSPQGHEASLMAQSAFGFYPSSQSPTDPTSNGLLEYNNETLRRSLMLDPMSSYYHHPSQYANIPPRQSFAYNPVVSANLLRQSSMLTPLPTRLSVANNNSMNYLDSNSVDPLTGGGPFATITRRRPMPTPHSLSFGLPTHSFGQDLYLVPPKTPEEEDVVGPPADFSVDDAGTSFGREVFVSQVAAQSTDYPELQTQC